MKYGQNLCMPFSSLAHKTSFTMALGNKILKIGKEAEFMNRKHECLYRKSQRI